MAPAREDRSLDLERFASLSRELHVVVQGDGTIVHAGPAFRSLGHDPDALVGRRVEHLLHPDDRGHAFAITDALRDPHAAGIVEVRARLRAADHRWVPIHWRLAWDALAARWHGVGTDCTMREELERRVLHDPLTGLPNRLLLLDRARQAIARLARTPDARVALAFLDLDGFKGVNDTHGHQTGDELLRAVAERLVSRLRGEDTVARLGGDEFVCLLQGAEDPEIVVRRVLDSFQEPFVVGGEVLRVTASVGLADAAGAGSDPEDMLREADVALYRAKGGGRARAATFDARMRQETLHRLETAADLRMALERDELELVFQPVVDLRSSTISSCEALLRWAHPQRGVLLPGDFLAIAEDDGQIGPIGEWVLHTACAQARAWRDAGSAMSVCVNVSARQLARTELLTCVRDALAASRLPGPALTLEVTETALLKRPDEAAATLTELRRDGVRVALDDFGEGYSSLRHLQALPVDVLKIDRSFVSRVHEDTGSRALVRSLCSLGRALGLQVVAEGVEMQVQDEVIRALGCTHGQGWLYGMPVPAQALPVGGYVGASQRGLGDQFTVREFMRQIGIPARIAP